MLFGKEFDGDGVLKAGSPHGAAGCVDFCSCQWGGCSVADPCENLVLAVSKILYKGTVQSKVDS